MYQKPTKERSPIRLLAAIVAISLWTSGEVDAQTDTASGVTAPGVHQLTLPDAATFDWGSPLYVIHSAADEVAPLEPTQAAVDQLLGLGVPVRLVVAEDITHYEISRYRSYLSDSIPWIRQAWAE